MSVGLKEGRTKRIGRVAAVPCSEPRSSRLPAPTIRHEAEVARTFDRLEGRFKSEVAGDDYRLTAVLRHLGPLRARRVLDLGCGKGRFAAHLEAAGAAVVGLDRSAAMLREAQVCDRVLASAHRLPVPTGSFDAVVAIEVFEHLADVDQVLLELRRVVSGGGSIVIVDKNVGALDGRRPWLPAVAIKRLDERRGRWMYPSGGPVRERWFWPRELAARLEAAGFEDVRIEHLLSPSERRWGVFRRVPKARLMTLWSAKVPGGARG